MQSDLLIPPVEAESEGGVCVAAVRPPPKKGQHSPSPTTTTLSPFALPGAMAAGIASRYKTGPRLETYR